MGIQVSFDQYHAVDIFSAYLFHQIIDHRDGAENFDFPVFCHRRTSSCCEEESGLEHPHRARKKNMSAHTPFIIHSPVDIVWPIFRSKSKS